jgi:serine phosphatase RsbU (regulator of sigma subunit)
MQIIQSRKGIIYAGTNFGICEILINPDGSLSTGNIYNSLTGYPVKDVTTGFNTIYEDKRGIIWAGTGSDKTALVRFDPESIRHNRQSPEVILQGVKINNENICWNILGRDKLFSHTDSLAILNEEYQTFGKELTNNEQSSMRKRFSGITFSGITRFFPVPENLILPYTSNNITIEYNALEPGRHQMIRYRYMLSGYDKDWSPVTDKTTAVFGNIFEGTYTFSVKASSPDGVWSEPLTYRFKVLPPWYRTWLMYFVYAVVLISGLYTFYRWRVARLKKENLLLEEKVKLRTIELQQANTEIQAQRDLVTKQKDHIEEIHKEVTDSIHYAKRLQTSALPNLKELRERFTDLFILFKPKDVVSGDFYWFAVSGDRIIFTVADCTGHGVPGAFMSMLGISLLKEIVIKGEMTRPDLILNLLRDEIIKALGQTGLSGEQKDGMDISLCSVNITTLELQWSGANLPCLIVRDGDMSELKGDKMPIAIYEKMDSFTLQEFKLQKNDIIYLSGDGYHDQFGGPHNKKFMSKRFKELLLSISNMPMEKQKEILNDKIENWETGYETKYQQTDDITVMGLKI